MNYFEKLLEKKCVEENTSAYRTQWEIDKKLYQKISSGINRSYPSFTDHGIIHSETILTNIERIFDEKSLETLSSFDIWLLLESAYLHDCGMFISIEKIEEIIKDDNKEFVKYIQEILINETHELYKYAKNFKIEDNNILFANNDYSPKIEFSMKYLLSFFKRGNHNIDFRDNIASQGKILQNRIYEVLYKICEAHGKTFEETLMLSKKESGIGKEVGHPLFIACLLRIGDLLDIDNNRATNLILEELKNDIPEKSQYNLEKHRAITHYWVDSEKVEIKATIRGKNTYKVAEITGKWFSFIEEEFQNQNYNWKDIKPEKFLAFLPKLGELGIEMDEYEYIDSKTKPKFSVDTNSILELLAGENIYENKGKALRELIQNSIDAVYLRIFAEQKESIKNMPEIVNDEIFENYEIQLFINKEKEDEDYEFYNIKIIDKGIGIAKEQLKYILTSGSSYHDKKKQVSIHEMPLWLQPSGNFGIGFQSIFMLTDKVILKSKSLYTNQALEVELWKPTTKYNYGGEVYFKKEKFDYKQDVGTEISFLCKLKKDKIYLPVDKNKNDFLIDEYLEENKELLNIKKELIDINSYSLVKIKFNGIFLKSNNKEQQLKKISHSKKIQILGVFTSEEKNKIERKITEGRAEGTFIFYYKNQYVQSITCDNFIFNFVINILGEKAKDVVQVDRNKLKNSYISNNLEEIEKAIFEYVINELPLNEKIDKKELGYFYFVNKNKLKTLLNPEIKKQFDEYENVFLNYKYFNEYSFSDILNKLDNGSIYVTLNVIKNIFTITKYKEDESNIPPYFETFLKFLIISEKKIKITYSSSETEIEKWTIEKLASTDERNIQVCGMTYGDLLDKNLRIDPSFSRFLVQNTGEYEKLRINFSKVNKYDCRIVHINLGPLRMLLEDNYILFPLIYNLEEKKGEWNSKVKEKYIEFVYKNQHIDKKYTEIEIEKELDRFIEDLDNDNRIKK